MVAKLLEEDKSEKVDFWIEKKIEKLLYAFIVWLPYMAAVKGK